MGLKRDLKLVSQGWRWGRRRLLPASVDHREQEPADFSTDWARTPAARAARSLILRGGFGPLIRNEVSASIYGKEVFDQVEAPLLLAANHSSHLDAPLVLLSIPKRLRDKTAVGAAADYFFDVWWRAFGTALAFNTFPVERSGSRRSAGPASDLIEEGWSILVFPEGTRSRDGWVGDFRLGTARLAIDHDIPIIPVGIRGTYQAMPRGRGWPVPGRPPVSVRFGAPLRGRAGESPAELSERMRDALAFALAEDRTTWWEALKMDERRELPDPSGPAAAPWRRKWESSRPVEENGRRRVWSSGRG